MSTSSENFTQWQPPDEKHTSRGGEIRWRDLSAGTWLKLITLYGVKILVALAWAMGFQVINPILSTLFLGDILPFPLPVELADMSASILVNLVLGGFAVLLPAALWHFALTYDVLRNPQDYFAGNPVRIISCVLMIVAYCMTISLELMSLMSRINDTVDQGPILTLGSQPDIVPLILSSTALIIGSCLLGLASASLSRSIHVRYGM